MDVTTRFQNKLYTYGNNKMSGSKAPDFDAHIRVGPKVFHPPMSKIMWA